MSTWRKTRLALLPVLAGLVACAGESKDEPKDLPPVVAATIAETVAVPQVAAIDGVPNARQVGSDLLFGGQVSPEALRALAGQGYRTVVNTRGEAESDWNEKAAAESLGLTYVAIPMPYPIENIGDDWVARFDGLMVSAERPMLVHCSSGNRVGGLWTVWLAERRGVAPDRALELGTLAGMTRIRPIVEKRLAKIAE